MVTVGRGQRNPGEMAATCSIQRPPASLAWRPSFGRRRRGRGLPSAHKVRTDMTTPLPLGAAFRHIQVPAPWGVTVPQRRIPLQTQACEGIRFSQPMKDIGGKRTERNVGPAPSLVDFKTVYEFIMARFSPAPHPRTVQAWLKDARVRSTKRNTRARRGGGRKWYVLADVERFIESLVK